MRNLNKAIAIICLTAVMICIGYRIKARANDIPTAPNVLQQINAGTMTGIGYAYDSLTSEQKTIAAYLVGAYANVYLMARGFSYSIPADESSFKAQYIAIGQRVWMYATSSYAWKSRFNETFRQYFSSVCAYASQISLTFEQWYQQNTGTNEIYIPYSENALDAWNEFWNDPTGDGIATFGAEVGPWDSGITYDFAFTNIPWNSNADQQAYNNFILNYSPVIFTSVYAYGQEPPSPYNNRQAVLSMQHQKTIDSVFILRSDNPQYARYGYSDFDLTFPNNRVYFYALNYDFNNSGHISLVSESPYSISGRGVINHVSNNYNELLAYVFNITPFNIDRYGSGHFAKYWYPYIEHVYLVDDINTLSNPEEIFNVTDLNILPPDSSREPYILAPNKKLLFPTRPVGYDDPLGFWDIVIDNSVDEDGNPASDADFNQNIVNNTVINNYYVTNDDKINVPVEWFENDLTDQLANDSIPFLTFARDCIDTLGDLQIYLYGAVVFGLGGGILKKFLL